MLSSSDALIITGIVTAAIASLAGAIVTVTNGINGRAERKNQSVKIEEVHGLVNSAMTEQKRITAMFAARVADATKDPKDIALAQEAQKIYDDAVRNAIKQV